MSYRQFVLGGAAALALFLPCTSHAQSAQTPKWQGHVEAEGKWGNKRSIGEGGLFIPVWQNEDTLLFTDLRTRFDNNSSNEGNFGLGLRKQINNDWIIGGYGFYDSRKTPSGNHFDQATFGAEAMSENMEFRINGYLPEATKKDAGSVSYSASASGGNFQISTFAAPKERALPGVDVEIGRKFDIPGDWTFWAYAGGYHFDASGYDNVTGPRGRLELSYDDVPYFGEGSRFTLGVEAQHDSVRDTQEFAIARLRIPFSSFSNSKKSNSNLDALDKRMTSRIYRDVDIVSGTQAGGQLESTETATATLANGTKVSGYTTIDATGAVAADVNAAGDNALIVLDGSAGTINTGVIVAVRNGQTLIGGGNTITLTGATSGGSATVTLPGTAATVHGTNAGVGVFDVSTGDNDVTFQGFTVDGGLNGIATLSATPNNLTITDMAVNNVAQNALHFNQASNITVSDTTINNAGSAGVSIWAGTISNLSFSNVTIDMAQIGLSVEPFVSTLNNPSGAITATNIGIADCRNLNIINGSTLLINGVLCN